jgi:hypothetical protein
MLRWIWNLELETPLTVYFVLVLAKYDDWGRRLLQTLEKIYHLGLLLDILDHLQHIEIGGTSTTDIHQYRLDERLLGKVLDFPRHCCGEQKSLALTLEFI